MWGMDWMELAQDKDRALVNSVMKFEFHKTREFLD